MSLTKGQIKMIRTLASKRFGPCDCSPGRGCDYHGWLERTFDGVTSTKDLSFAQAGRAIDALADRDVQRRRNPVKADTPWKGRYTVPGAEGMITQTQADEVARLEHELGWHGQPNRLQGMIRRQLGRPDNVTTSLPALANRQASSLITALRRVLSTIGDRPAQQTPS